MCDRNVLKRAPRNDGIALIGEKDKESSERMCVTAENLCIACAPHYLLWLLSILIV